MNEEIIIGRNPVMEALKSGRAVNKVLVSDQLNQQTEKDLFRAVKKANTILQKVPKKRIDQKSTGKHQGIIAYVAAYEYATIEQILQRATDKGKPPFLMILDEIEYTHNLGAILITWVDTDVHV